VDVAKCDATAKFADISVMHSLEANRKLNWRGLMIATPPNLELGVWNLNYVLILTSCF